MVKKDDKMGNKSRYRKGKERKDRDQERRIQIDSQKKSKFCFLHKRQKQKWSLITSIGNKSCESDLKLFQW